MYERLLEFENKIKVESIYNCIHLMAIGIQFFSIKPHKRNTHVVMYVRRIRDIDGWTSVGVWGDL